jgi:hypothetical protein
MLIYIQFVVEVLRVPKGQIAYIYPGASKKHKEEQIRLFQTREKDLGEFGGGGTCARILIAPTSVISHGLNLPLKEYVFILEPDFLRRNQEQLIGRAIRPQNGNKEVFVYIFIA